MTLLRARCLPMRLVVALWFSVSCAIATVEECTPLHLDVQWILQGRDLSFTGFFVEFLGISGSFRHLLPMGRLAKSSFHRRWNEDPFKHGSVTMYQELFEKEAVNMQYILGDGYPGLTESALIPYSKFIREIDEPSMLCSHEMEQLWIHNQSISDSPLAKNRLLLQPNSTSNDCCFLCSRDPLCVSWHFEHRADGHQCVLCGARNSHHDEQTSPLHAATSHSVYGNMVMTDPHTQQRTGIAVKPRALIFHGTTCVYRNQSIHAWPRNSQDIYIGRFMLERERFVGGYTKEEYSVIRCAALMDELWVPTQWQQEQFTAVLLRELGRVPPIIVIPEAVDTELFDNKRQKVVPSTVTLSTSTSHDAEEVAIDALGVETEVVKGEGKHRCAMSSVVFPVQRVHCSAGQPFTFISIFKWEYRKGWDILLRSFWSAFSRDDDVLLRIITYVPNGAQNNDSHINHVLHQFALQHFSKPLESLAAVEIITDANIDKSDDRNSRSHTREEVKAMLVRADAFVLASRGEGWGLPIAEAMSLRLPVIVSNCTGPSSYASPSNAYVVPVEDQLDGSGFVIPREDDLRAALRQAVVDVTSRNISQKVAQARITMEQLSPQKIVCQMIQRLQQQAARRGWEFKSSKQILLD